MRMPAINHEISFEIEICNYLAAHDWPAAVTGKTDVRSYIPKEAE